MLTVPIQHWLHSPASEKRPAEERGHGYIHQVANSKTVVNGMSYLTYRGVEWIRALITWEEVWQHSWLLCECSPQKCSL